MSETAIIFCLAPLGKTVSMTSLHGNPSNWPPTFALSQFHVFNMKMNTTSRFLFSWKITWKCPKLRKNFASLRSARQFRWLFVSFDYFQLGHLPSTLTHFDFNQSLYYSFEFCLPGFGNRKHEKSILVKISGNFQLMGKFGYSRSYQSPLMQWW